MTHSSSTLCISKNRPLLARAGNTITLHKLQGIRWYDLEVRKSGVFTEIIYPHLFELYNFARVSRLASLFQHFQELASCVKSGDENSLR